MLARDRKLIYADQIDQLYSLEHLALGTTVICSGVLVFFHWSVASHRVLITWLSAMTFLTLIRVMLLIQYRRLPELSGHASKWGKIFIAGALLSGTGWGTSVIFLFPPNSIQHQIFTIFVLGGMIAGAVAVYSALKEAFVAFALPASIPMIAQAFLMPDSFHLNVCAMFLVFVAAMLVTGWQMNRMVVTSLELRVENRDLIEFLAEGKKRAETLNQRLQAEIKERAKAEAEVRRHREQLEYAVATATAELKAANEQLTLQMNSCRQAEESLRESEEKYRNLFEYSNDCIFLHDPDGGIIDANRKALEELGFSKSEIQSKNLRSLHPPEVSETIDTGLEQVKQRGFANFEVPFVKRGGEIFHAEVSSSLFAIGGRQVIQKIVRNITERKLMEKELKQTKEYLENVIENAVDAIGIVERQGRFILWNKRAAELFGYSTEEMKGRHYSSLYADERTRDDVLTLLREEGVVRQFEISMLRKDGNEMPMELSMNVLKNDEGETIGSLCLARDLTEKKMLEAQLLHATKMEAVGTLAGGIAHDFNNLLQAIQGYADLLLFDKKESEPEYRELKEINRAAQRGAELTKQLLTFSRKVDAKLRPINLNLEVKQIVGLLERTIPKMVAIEVQLEKDLKRVNADPTQMEQTIINLAVNAKDAMPEGGKLIIETGNRFLSEEYCRLRPDLKPGPYVLLTITDTGHGMDRETLQHIFDPFFSTKEVGKGTGLGLAMVYGIVKNHGGHIECISEPGQGSRFEIYLPALEFTTDAGVTFQSKAPRGGRETILLVDDEESVREVGVSILKRFGYTVLTAADGEAALDTYLRERDRIDLVILDLIMPGMGGRRCLDRLLEIDPQVRVIISSGHFTEGAAINPVEMGAKSFMRKPYQAHVMLETVSQVLER
jgi:two-component system, cell cycle sensor histidine kinase and response regulator CckA